MIKATGLSCDFFFNFKCLSVIIFPGSSHRMLISKYVSVQEGFGDAFKSVTYYKSNDFNCDDTMRILRFGKTRHTSLS